MQTKVKYLAIAENMVYSSSALLLVTNYPRKELLDILGATHADKVYVDTEDGKPEHIGYVIRNVWYTLYQVVGRGPKSEAAK